jgi:hypothetical protein
MAMLDIFLMALVSVVTLALLTWSICTQYRDAGCDHLRIRRRLRVRARMVRLDEPSMVMRDVRTSA